MNGAVASAVSGTGHEYTFSFASVPLGLVTVTWAPNHDITDTESPANAFDSAVAGEVRHYIVADQEAPTVINRSPVADARLRGLSELSVTFSEPVTDLEAEDLTANGAPATSLTGEGAGPYLFTFDPINDGPVTLSWTAGHAIADLAFNPLISEDWSYILVANARIPNVVINELMASNRSGLTDEDGDYSDWIELLNKDNSAVNLLGWSLSDDIDQPGKFILPEIILQPGGRLLVMASGKDRSPAGEAEIHTNFKLAVSGEYLGLFPPELPREAADEIAPSYPVQRNDHSYGRESDGEIWRYFASPTPRVSNGPQPLIRGLLDSPHFSSPRGLYDQPFNLRLTSPDPQAVIRYTADGSEPTSRNGTIYSAPIPVESTRIIRAAAFRTDYLSSEIITHSYFYDESSAIRSLPIVSVSTDDSNLWGPTGIQTPGNAAQRGIAWERPASVELIRQDQSGFQENCGIRVQGGDHIRARYNPNSAPPASKYSFRIYFRGDYGATMLHFPFFEGSEVKVFDRFTLRAGMNDHSNPFVLDEMVRRMQIATGNVGARGNFVNLFINGEYKGYYNATERIDDDFMRSWHGGDNDWDVIAQYGEIREGNAREWQRMMELVRRDQSNLSNYRRSARLLDMDNFIDYLLVNVYCGTRDWPHNNWRAARERGSRTGFRFYVWDAEHALAHNGNTLTSELGGGSEIAQIYQALVRSPEFRLRWADRAHKHLFNGGALIDRTHNLNFRLIRREMQGVIPNMSDSVLRNWIPNRRAEIIGHMRSAGLYRSDEAPEMLPFGGPLAPTDSIELSSTGDRIYYTTDGSDPRLAATAQNPLGSVSPQASLYTEPFTLNGTGTIKSRSLSGTDWSALTEAEFLQEPRFPNLRITEIMYNPPGGSTYEFIELHNPSSRTIDLGHFSFQGITYQFPGSATLSPQQRIVLSSNDDQQSFAQRYPGVRSYGTFGGSLSNGGERLTLVDGFGNNIISVRYNDRAGWPRSADGGGYSLVLRDIDGDSNDPTSWSASPQVHGSPGEGDSAEIRSSVVINEVLAHNESAVAHGNEFPPFVELHNSGANAVDLSGWSLSDDADLPHKFSFPQGTSIDGGGHLLIWCTTPTGVPPLFATETVLVADNPAAAASALVPTTGNGGNTLSVADWTNVAAPPNAANWSAGTTGIGYEASPGSGTSYSALLGLDLLAQMRDLTSSAYVRVPFTIDQPALSSARGLFLEMKYDDGFIAYLNGVQVTSANAPGQPGPSSAASADNSDSRALQFEQFDVSAYVHLLNPGTNMLAIHGLNDGDNSSDFLIVPRLTASDATPPGLHSGFELSPEGGFLFLTNPSGSQTDDASYGLQVADFSISRNGKDWSLTVPTPGNPNGTSVPLASQSELTINEWVTNRIAGEGDWLELHNKDANHPVALRNLYLASDEAVYRYGAISFIAPRAFKRFWADEGSGPEHLGFRLPASGGTLQLIESNGVLIENLRHTAQAENLASGRLPDGATTVRDFSNSSSPGASNYLGASSGLSISELHADSHDQGLGWVELSNDTSDPLPLGGHSLVVGNRDGTPWTFPPGLSIPANGFLVVNCDTTRAPSSIPGALNTGRSLPGIGGEIYFFDDAAQEIDRVLYGAQIPGLSIGSIPDGSWRLLSSPTPGEANTSAALLGAVNSLSINEWLAKAPLGLEDFVELYNSSDRPVALHLLRLTDDLSSTGLAQFSFPELNYIAPGGFLALLADGESGAGHLPFSLHAMGETLRLYQATGTVIIDEVSWGVEEEGVSSGRLTDGGPDLGPLQFQSPGGSNLISPNADRDGDEMPDSWETAHGLDPSSAADANLDLDGDRRTNLYEYRSNTDPTDSTSFLQFSTFSHDGTEVALTFTAQPGIRYRIEQSDNGIDWSALSVIPAGPTMRVESLSDRDGGASEFYRLVAERMP
ncbi:MAG: lamin tail domain-containing protein [Roseibacillus sp.]|nr:lamin tail domain-containing protein [Roseibacillus sp.]